MELVAALDLGSDKIVVALASIDNRGYKLESLKNMTSRGIEHGVIKDFSAVRNDVRDLLEDTLFNKNVSLLRVSLSVNVFNIQKHTVEYHLGRLPVTDIDLQKAQQKCLDSLSSKGDIISVLPINYVFDKTNSVSNPINKTGQLLEITYIVYTVNSDYIARLNQIFDYINPAIKREYCPSIYAYQELIPRDGVILDIGADGMEISIFTDYLLKNHAYLPLGGNVVDSDIAAGFRIEEMQARKLKQNHGQALKSTCKNRTVQIDGTEKCVERRDIATIMQLRLEELFEGVIYFLNTCKSFNPQKPIFLTGGLSQVEDISILLNRMSSCKIERLAIARIHTERNDILEKPEYAVALGLLLRTSPTQEQESKGPKILDRILKTIFG